MPHSILHFHAVGHVSPEAWVQNHYQQIAKWFDENPSFTWGNYRQLGRCCETNLHISQGAETQADDFPLRVGENTGLSSQQERYFALHESDLACWHFDGRCRRGLQNQLSCF